MSGKEKPWWYPVLVDEALAAQLRADYPGDAWRDDKHLFEHFEYDRKYLTTWDGTGDAYEQYEKVSDRLLELEAIVAKLPLTADGVPVVPGMLVWLWPYSSIQHLRVVTLSHEFYYEYDEETVAIYIEVELKTGIQLIIQPDRTFSTREAAAAAGGEL